MIELRSALKSSLCLSSGNLSLTPNCTFTGPIYFLAQATFGPSNEPFENTLVLVSLEQRSRLHSHVCLGWIKEVELHTVGWWMCGVRFIEAYVHGTCRHSQIRLRPSSLHPTPEYGEPYVRTMGRWKRGVLPLRSSLHIAKGPFLALQRNRLSPPPSQFFLVDTFLSQRTYATTLYQKASATTMMSSTYCL